MLEVVTEELLNYQNNRLQVYQKGNQNIDKDATIFVGDSIIEFYPLKKYFGRNETIYNRGIAGIDTYFLEKHLEDYLYHLEAKRIFLLIGTNDLGLGHSISDIKEKVIDIVSKLKIDNIYAEVNLISVLPVSDLEMFSKTVKVRSNDAIDQLNSELEAILGITFIPIANHLKNDRNALNDYYTKDGLHLNVLGYDKLSQLLKPYLS
ncbi:GDSL-type esterase/lipase family protein [Streptococcus iniae]